MKLSSIVPPPVYKPKSLPFNRWQRLDMMFLGGFIRLPRDWADALIGALLTRQLTSTMVRSFLGLIDESESFERRLARVARLQDRRPDQIMRYLEPVKRYLLKWRIKERPFYATFILPRRALRLIVAQATKAEVLVFLHLCKQVMRKTNGYVSVLCSSLKRKWGVEHSAMARAVASLRQRRIIQGVKTPWAVRLYHGTYYRFKDCIMPQVSMASRHNMVVDRYIKSLATKTAMRSSPQVIGNTGLGG